jgi:carbon-monoxide dehydrogenase medium subunit
MGAITFDKKDSILRIGAMATLSEIVSNPLVIKNFGIIANAADEVASVQIRNRATIGGNICNASPAADTIPALLVLQSKLKLIGSTGHRIVPLENFFTGPRSTVLKADEILTEVVVPLPPARSTSVYLKHGVRKAMNIAIVGLAVLIVFDSSKKNIFEDIRIGLGSVAPTPIRALRAEKILSGKAPQNHIIEAAAIEAANETSPISDIRASAEYRREIVRVLTERAIKDLITKKIL